jgi:hypothetical protein
MQLIDLELELLDPPARRPFCQVVGFVDGIPVGNVASGGGPEVGCAWWPSGPELVLGSDGKRKSNLRFGRGSVFGGQLDGRPHATEWVRAGGEIVVRDRHFKPFRETCASAGRDAVVVGFATTRDVSSSAVIWIEGKPRVLAPENRREDAYGHGVGGGRCVGQIGRVGAHRACWWDLASGDRTEVAPDGFSSTILRDAGADYLVGEGWTAAGLVRPLLWPDSGSAEVEDLTPPGFGRGALLSCDDAWQVGFVEHQAERAGHAALWVGSAATFLDLHDVVPEPYTDSAALLVEVEGDEVRVAGYVAAYSTRKNPLGELLRAQEAKRAAVWRGHISR